MAYGDAEEERKRLHRDYTAKRNRLTGAILRGDDDIARVTVGVPPTFPGSDDLGDLDDLSEPDNADLPDDLDEPDSLDLSDDLDEPDALLDYVDNLDEPEPAGPLSADEQFRARKRQLLFDLTMAAGWLPQAAIEDWTARAEQLDLAQPEAGLDEITTLRTAYGVATYGRAPPVTDPALNMEWERYVAPIGDELRQLERLFRQVLTFR